VEVATRAHLAALERLLRMGRFVSSGVAAEDLPSIVDRGKTLLAGGAEHPWGVFVIDAEPRPDTLPSDAPNRAEVRAVAMRNGPWLESAGEEFGRALQELVARAGAPFEISVYAGDAWLQRFLAQAGFSQGDEVVFLKRTHLLEPLPALAPLPGVVVRAVEPADLGALAALDAVTFIPLWHFGRKDLMELLVRGRLVLAELAEEPPGSAFPRLPEGGWAAGYSALLPSRHKEAHLARLAVHPWLQGRGVGRLLLVEAMYAAREMGVHALALNTQRSNQRSQQLYRSAGFAPTGVALPVFLRRLP